MSRMYVPVMSDGSRSGVNCTRRKFIDSVCANALTSVVLATPGLPSISTWPRATSAVRMASVTVGGPMKALPTSSRMVRPIVPTEASCSGVMVEDIQASGARASSGGSPR